MSEVRIFPEQAERVETGVIRFGDDWPGVFIRGDNAAGLSFHLQEGSGPFFDLAIEQLISLLNGSILHQ